MNDARTKKEYYIAALCIELNEKKDSIRWDEKTLREHVENKFGATLGNLCLDCLDSLAEELKGRLKELD